MNFFSLHLKVGLFNPDVNTKFYIISWRTSKITIYYFVTKTKWRFFGKQIVILGKTVILTFFLFWRIQPFTGVWHFTNGTHYIIAWEFSGLPKSHTLLCSTPPPPLHQPRCRRLCLWWLVGLQLEPPHSLYSSSKTAKTKTVTLLTLMRYKQFITTLTTRYNPLSLRWLTTRAWFRYY